jgi:mRNA-degrading endonuclease YafQ of YafQ-DinJ toxin-antitoxin module
VKRELVRTNAFICAAKRYAKKNSQSAIDIESALVLLAADAFDPRLKTHKLKGD